MTDIESRLRQTLHGSLDPIAPDARRVVPTFRRARRGRIVRAAATGLASVLVVAVAATAWERRDDRGPVPAGDAAERGTYSLSFADGATGTITIDVPKAQACIKLSGASAVSAHLHRDPLGPDPTLVELRMQHVGAWTVCQSMDPGDAANVVRDPRSHYVELHLVTSSGVAALEPLDLAPEEAPLVAEIVCSQDGAVAITPQVQAQEDGIHLRFYNPSRRWRALTLLNDGGENEGGHLPFGRHALVSTFPPGLLYAGCFERLNDAVLGPRDDAYARLTIVDPRGLWTEPDLECDDDVERPVIATDEPLPDDLRRLPDFESLIREHVPGVEAGDVLERPGYPGTEFHFEPRTVVRDGRRIAGLMLVPKGRHWAIDPRVCPGSGIANS